nr:hypothetical protein [Desulfobacula sp.]
MEIICVLACCFFFIHILKNKAPLYAVPGITPLLIFLFYILFQLFPLPPAMVAFLSPEAFDIHQTTRLITGTDSWMPLTVNIKATLSEFFRYSTYVLFYVLTVHLLSQKEHLQATALTIVLFGGLLAFSSILQFYLTDDMALWFRHSPTNSIVVGPYANHNHYAGLMEMMFPLVLGLFLFYRPRMGNTSLIKGIAEILSQEKANIHILIGASALLIILSIFVSLSRGAMISTCLSLLLFTFLLMGRKINKGNTALIIGIILITALCIGWFGWDQIFERFAKLKNTQGIIYESRLDFWKDSFDIIKHFTITGAGFGAFSHIYPLHRSIISELFLTHAHNDYLELLAEGGIIGFMTALCFLAALFYKTYKTFSARRDAISIYLYIGSITALAAILLHSFTDFNLHIGANGLWFFFIAGIAVASANTGIRKQSRPTRLTAVDSKTIKTFSGVLLCLMIFFSIAFNISNLLGIFYFSHIKGYTITADTPLPIIQQIKKTADSASRLDPFQSKYPFMSADTAWFLKDIKISQDLYTSALYLDPLNSRHLNRYATFLARGNEPEKAEIAFKKSMRYDQSNPEYTFEYAAWLLSKRDNEQGLFYMKKTLEMNGKFMGRALTAMIIAGIDSETIEAAIPETPGPAVEFARFLFETGQIDPAIHQYIKSLDLLEDMEFSPLKTQAERDRIKKSHYFSVFQFFKRHNDLRNAMETMERAEKALPMDPDVKTALGDLYYQQGILFKALDKYDHALLLNPGNPHALKMVKKINP